MCAALVRLPSVKELAYAKSASLARSRRRSGSIRGALANSSPWRQLPRVGIHCGRNRRAEKLSGALTFQATARTGSKSPVARPRSRVAEIGGSEGMFSSTSDGDGDNKPQPASDTTKVARKPARFGRPLTHSMVDTKPEKDGIGTAGARAARTAAASDSVGRGAMSWFPALGPIVSRCHRRR